MGIGLVLALNPNHRKSRHWHKDLDVGKISWWVRIHPVEAIVK
jgi:hypothetical protein